MPYPYDYLHDYVIFEKLIEKLKEENIPSAYIIEGHGICDSFYISVTNFFVITVNGGWSDTCDGVTMHYRRSHSLSDVTIMENAEIMVTEDVLDADYIFEIKLDDEEDRKFKDETELVNYIYETQIQPLLIEHGLMMNSHVLK